jgi:hypothetical protein
MNKDIVSNILMRILATFAASGLGVIGAGTIAGVPIWKSVFMAGIAGVATVVEGLSRAFLDDGKLTASEINAVFSRFDKKGGPVSDEEMAAEETESVKNNKSASSKSSTAGE